MSPYVVLNSRPPFLAARPMIGLCPKFGLWSRNRLNWNPGGSTMEAVANRAGADAPIMNQDEEICF
jgi:hypothetical protein